MPSKIPTRQDAYAILTRYNKTDGLIKHALAVEGGMRYCARKRGEDEEKKWKDKRFASGVDRSVIEKGAGMLGMELSELITDTIMGMREVAEQVGLKGALNE